MQQSDQVLMTSDVARMLEVSGQAVRVMVERGELPAMRTPKGHRIFLRRDVIRLMAQRDAAAHAKGTAA